MKVAQVLLWLTLKYALPSLNSGVTRRSSGLDVVNIPFSMPADTIERPWASTNRDLALFVGALAFDHDAILAELTAVEVDDDNAPTFGRTEGTNAFVEPMAAPRSTA